MSGRIRTVKPTFFTDADLCELPPLTRILFEGLWVLSDRAGRLADKPREIKVKALPFDEWDVDKALCALAHAGFIVRYEAGGERLIWVRTFSEHQRPNVREPASAIPPPTEEDVARACTCMHVHARADPQSVKTGNENQETRNASQHVHARGEGKGREEEGNGRSAVPADAATPAAPAQASLPVEAKPLPKRGGKQGEFYDWCMADRTKRVAPGTADDATPGKQAWPALVKLLEDHGRKTAEAAWLAFCGDDYAQRAAYPMALFANQWPRWVTAAQRTATGPPRPAPDVRRGVVRAEDALDGMEPPGEVQW